MKSANPFLAGVIRPLSPRDSSEAHRAATPLELLFDLVSVIAIAAAAAGLHHSIAEAHAVQGLITFLMAFFAIWWAWMNYTWFASAYDNDDPLFRLLTMVLMGGSLTMAAGIGLLFESLDFNTVIIGYVIMRIAMILLWLRAARHDPVRRQTALAYAAGIFLVQLFWVGFALVQPVSSGWAYTLFIVGVVLELAVPVVAERKNTTPWHRHHIIERYGLLNIIVLGETLLAGSLALRAAAGEHFEIAHVHTAISALVIVFSMWWLYFCKQEHLENQDLNRALIWGYGHFIIFASGAAVGAGFAVLVDIITHHAEVSLTTGDYAVAIPVALYMLGLWFVRDRFVLTGAARHVIVLFALLVLLAPLTPLALEGVAAFTALGVIARNYLASKDSAKA